MPGAAPFAERHRRALDAVLHDLTDAAYGGPDSIRRSALAALGVIATGVDVGREKWVNAVTATYSRSTCTGGGRAEIDLRRDGPVESTRSATVVSQAASALVVTSFRTPPRGIPALIGDEIDHTSDPQALPRHRADAEVTGAHLPLDVRPFDKSEQPLPIAPRSTVSRTWVRYHRELPDDILVHAAALTLATGYVLPLVGASHSDAKSSQPPNDMPTQLQAHSLWLDRCFRADDWLVLTVEAHHPSHDLTAARAEVHTSLGRRVAQLSAHLSTAP